MSTRIASTIVNECLRIKDDDVVSVHTFPHTVELANAIARQLNLKGADFFVGFETDEIMYSNFMDSSIEHLKKTSKIWMSLANTVTAQIFLGGPMNPAPMRRVPREKWAASFESEKPIFDRTRERKVRQAFLALGQVTKERAKTYGFSYNSWKKAVTVAMTVKHEKMKSFGTKVREKLTRGRQVRITAPNGTDLRFETEPSRPIIIGDGIIDDEDIAMGGTFLTLPSGSVWLAPNETSTNGKIVFDVPTPQFGVLVKGLSWTFRDGRVTEYAAAKNLEAVKPVWEQSTGDKDRIGTFGLGINPRAKFGFLNNAIVMGGATVSIGANKEAGGINDTSYFFEGTLSKATVTVDGETLLSQGKFTGA